jgi:hypothetical protein
MTEKEFLERIEQRRQTDPEFRKKLDAFLAKRKAEENLSDSELSQVSGGFIGYAECPKCGQYDGLFTYSLGIYNYCTYCGYEEWGRGWY